MPLTNWSYSRYGTWKKCPAQLKFSMEHTGEREQHPAAARGQSMHKNIEDYLLGKVELMLELAYYHEFLTAIRDEAVPELPLALDAAWSPVDWDDPDRWWRGILDCVIELDGVPYIYDWKTGNEYGDHRDQREIYAAAYDSASGPFEDIVVIHCYLDKKQNTVSHFKNEDLPPIRKKWEKNIEEMFNDKAMVPNPGFHCRFCQFRRDNGGPCQF